MKLYRTHRLKFLTLLTALPLASSLSMAQDSGGSNGPPLVVVVAPDPVALEGTSSGAFTLIRYGPTDADLAIDVRLSGSASNGVDYATIDDVITIPKGSQATDIKVDPIADTANLGNKTVVLTLKTNANYRIGSHHSAEVKIIDDVFDIPPPTVTLTAPTDNSAFTNPPSITLSADTGNSVAAIRSVSFYANDHFLGRSTSSPFSLIWSNPPSGHFGLFARAEDQFGRSALSAPVHILVVDIDPVVTLTSPTNGANFMVHQNISLAADVSDPDPTQTIDSVSFFANGHLLGKVSSTPYSLIWSNAPSGFFTLRAVARTTIGDKGYSQPVIINVTPFSRKMISK
jgi:hypothetical protein